MLLVILALIAIARNPAMRKVLLAGTAVIAAVAFVTFTIVSSATQVRGRNGRVQTNLSFVLLDRVVWSHIAENYDDFPQEIRDTFSLEDAKAIDKQNNNILYLMAPTMEARFGRERAEACYREMARIVWDHQAGDVLRDIGEYALAFLCSPLLQYLGVTGRYTKSGVRWNTKCLSQATPELTTQYILCAFYILIFMLAVALLVRILDRALGYRRRGTAALWPFVIAGVCSRSGSASATGRARMTATR